MGAIKSRPPTGIVPWPFILVEGPEKSGKSWSIAELSTSSRVGMVYWLDVGEGAGDEYGEIPGANYQVLIHDGSWWSMIEQIDAVTEEAQRAVDAGEPPIVLGIDSGTALWDLLKGWADERARERLRRKGKKPGDDVTISMDLWNSAGARHASLITKLHKFPGIVVVTARGKEVAALDDNGKPLEGQKTYKVEGQKNLAFDASVWVRFSRERPPQIVGARSVHYGVRPGVDQPKPTNASFNLDKLVFDVLRCDPAKAQVRDVQPLSGGELAEHERDDPPPTAATSAGPSSGDGKSDAGVQRIDDLAKKKRDAYQRAIEASKTLGMSKAEFEKELRSEQGVGWTDGTAAQFTTFAQSLEQIAEAGKTPADGQGELISTGSGTTS